MIDSKNGNPAVEAAVRLGIDDIENAQLEQSEKHRDALKGAKVNDAGKIMAVFGGLLQGPRDEAEGVSDDAG